MTAVLTSAACSEDVDTCPLCLRHYPLDAARTCGACGAHSCDACVEPSRTGATLRCFACGVGRPTFVPDGPTFVPDVRRA